MVLSHTIFPYPICEQQPEYPWVTWPLALPVLSDCLGLSVSLLLLTLLSPQFLFFLGQTLCFALEFLLALALGASWLTLLFTHFATVHTVHGLGPSSPSGSSGSPSIPCYFLWAQLWSVAIPQPIFWQAPHSSNTHTCPFYFGRGLFCPFSTRGPTGEQGRKGRIWSLGLLGMMLLWCCCDDAGCTGSLMPLGSLRTLCTWVHRRHSDVLAGHAVRELLCLQVRNLLISDVIKKQFPFHSLLWFSGKKKLSP